MRVAVLTACMLLCSLAPVHADSIATRIAQLSDGSARVRLTAAVSLSKSRDPRAVNALASALQHDRDADIRFVAAVALEKMIDARTAPDAIEIGLRALDAARRDPEARVRLTAARAYRALIKLRPRPRGTRPAVFVNVESTLDQSRRLPPGGGARVTRIVRQNVERTGYATTWPGGLPTSAELASSRARAFVVASTIKRIEVTKIGTQTQIACTVAVRIAPWGGSDGGERWEANRAASASGSAKAMTGNRVRDIEGGMRDCVEAVAEDVTSRQVVPFLRRIARSGG